MYLLGGFLSGYFIIEKTGIFDVSSLSTINIIHSLPFLTGSTTLFVILFLYILTSRRTLRLRGWLYLFGISLIVSGLWVGYLTGLYAEVVITEGQGFYSGHDEVIYKYKGKFATLPDIGIKLDKLNPEFNRGHDKIKRLQGEFIYFRKDRTQTKVVITERLPGLIDGMVLRIKDFGYSPRFVLKSEDGVVLTSSFVYMRLFPEGKEDYFRLLSPHTYYLRYYPSQELFRLRIVRNKDIVFNRNIGLHEEASFDNGKISFEEVRRWTRLSITRDWGMIISLTGTILLSFTFLTKKLALRKRRFLHNIKISNSMQLFIAFYLLMWLKRIMIGIGPLWINNTPVRLK